MMKYGWKCPNWNINYQALSVVWTVLQTTHQNDIFYQSLTVPTCIFCCIIFCWLITESGICVHLHKVQDRGLLSQTSYNVRNEKAVSWKHLSGVFWQPLLIKWAMPIKSVKNSVFSIMSFIDWPWIMNRYLSNGIHVLVTEYALLCV